MDGLGMVSGESSKWAVFVDIYRPIARTPTTRMAASLDNIIERFVGN